MVAVFGTLFNDIAIPRFNANGDVTELLHVPISYGPKERVEAISIDNKDLTKQSAVSPLPRLSFEMRPPVYDATRALNPTQTSSVVRDANTGNYQRQFEPVPYNFGFTLWVYAKTISDGNKIIEQILPFFRPEFPVTVELIPQLGFTTNIPVILNSVLLSDTYEGDFTGERRAIIWTLDFTMKGYYFGPISEDAIIKFAKVEFYAPTVQDLTTAVGNSSPVAYVTVQPGLTANGQPTSNIAQTIPYVQINSTDPFGYITIINGDTNPAEGGGGNQSNNLPFQN